MVKILIQSDLHLEFGDFKIESMEDEKNIVLILAGDIGLITNTFTYASFIADVCSRFRAVIWVLGNHETYGSHFTLGITKLREDNSKYKNLHILQDQTLIIDDVAFIASTLWTNFENEDISCMSLAERCMADYSQISNGDDDDPWSRRLQPEDTLLAHKASRQFIFSQISQHKKEYKTVVVTHHCPSYTSIPAIYKNNRLNGAFTTALDADIIKTQPNIWIHGHTHSTFDYMINKTRIICNPRGYRDEYQCNGFNPLLVIDV